MNTGQETVRCAMAEGHGPWRQRAGDRGDAAGEILPLVAAMSFTCCIEAQAPGTWPSLRGARSRRAKWAAG